MLTAVAVVQAAFFLLGLQWQLYRAYGGVTTGVPYRRDVVHQQQQPRRVQSATQEYTGRTPSPEFVRHYHNRIRNRESRIVQILVEVSDAVNNGRGNYSSAVRSPISESQLDSIKKRFKEDAKLPPQDGDTRISRTILLPACGASADDGNRNSSVRATRDFRIFFNVVPPRRILHPETVQIKSAHLFLRVKPADDAVVAAAADDKKPKTRKTGGKTASLKIPNDVMKVQIHSFDAAKLKEKSSPIGEKKEKGKKRRRGRGVAGKKRPLKSIFFDPRNSSDWLKIGLLRAAERWYQLAIRQPGLRVTVVNSQNQRVDPFQIFYDVECELQKFPVQQRSTLGEIDDEDAGKGGREDSGTDGESHPDSSSSSSSDDSFTLPYLEIVSKASPKKLEVRKQRHLVIQRRNSCHMRHVQVNTEDKRLLNMTNIIAPVHFKSAVCEGFCSRCDQTSRSRSDVIQASALGSDCSCQPVKTKSLPVVYDDENGRVYVRSIPDAVVTKCGCRP